MKTGQHGVVQTPEGYRVIVLLMVSENGVAHFNYAEDRAYPTRFGADRQAALLMDLAATPVEEKACA